MKKYIILSLFIFSFAKGITLDEIIKLAEKNNPVLKEKYLETRIQHYKSLEAKRKKYGEINLFGQYNKYEDKRILYPISPPLNPLNLVGAENQFIIGAEYRVPLFLGFQLRKNIEINNIGKELKNIQYKLTKNQLIYNIKVIYLNILSLQKQLKASIEYKKSLEKLHENISEMVKLGRKPEVDLLKVEYELKNAEANIEKLKNSINSLKQGLRTLVGDENLALDNLEDIKPKNIQITINNLDINQLDKIKTFYLQEKIAKRKIKIAIGSYLPKIYFHASAQRNMGASEYKDLWNIGVSLNWTIFDFGQRYSNYIQSKLELQKIKLEKKNTYLKIKQDITEALDKIKTAEAEIKAREKQLKYSKEVEDIEKLKYQEGVSSIYDYLKAKAQYYMAESLYYKSIYDKEIAISYLEYLLEKYKR
jgi:outer membrane protein TolC